MFDFGVLNLVNIPGTPSLVFSFYVLALLPWMAYRSSGRLRRQPGLLADGRMRRRVWRSTLLMLLLLLWLATVTGRGFGYDVFEAPQDLRGTVWRSALCLVVSLLLMVCSSLLRTAEQRREMFVYRLVPGDGGEWALKLLVAMVAGVAEEAVYRGVLLQILWYSLGSFVAAVAISAIAFALAHRQQGWQSMVLIVAIALLMHWLVQATGSLLGAMAAHTLYDVVAMFWISKQAQRDSVSAETVG